MNQQNNLVKPFIKWVGGKGQLLPQLEANLPPEVYQQEFVYVEPFVGGGAMLFFMLSHFPNIKRVVINDVNTTLTDTYQVLKCNVDELIACLRKIENHYFPIPTESERKEYYLEMRRSFNFGSLNKIEKSALFIFLNHTCFNGLYRENSRGLFNVPFGKYTNPTICNEPVLRADSELLNKFDIEILNKDYIFTGEIINTHEDFFFYFDPPYRPLSATSSFNSYVKEAFDDNCQRALSAFCKYLNRYKNVKWMLSNSDCSSVNPTDTFFEDLYEQFFIQRVEASRMVNANASKRGKLTELLISNFNNKQTKNKINSDRLTINKYESEDSLRHIHVAVV